MSSVDGRGYAWISAAWCPRCVAAGRDDKALIHSALVDCLIRNETSLQHDDLVVVTARIYNRLKSFGRLDGEDLRTELLR